MQRRTTRLVPKYQSNLENALSQNVGYVVCYNLRVSLLGFKNRLLVQCKSDLQKFISLLRISEDIGLREITEL